MIIKPDILLCDMFLLAFLTLTVHKPQQILKVLGQGQLTNRNVPVKMFNCSVNIKTKDCVTVAALPTYCFHGKVS